MTTPEDLTDLFNDDADDAPAPAPPGGRIPDHQRASVRFLMAATQRYLRMRQSLLFRRWFRHVVALRQVELDAPASFRSVLALVGTVAGQVAPMSTARALSGDGRNTTSDAGEKTDSSSDMYDRGKPKAPFPNEKSLSEFISAGNRFQRLQGFKFNKDAFASHLRQSQSKVVLSHGTWPRYVLADAVIPAERGMPPRNAGEILRKDLLRFSTFVDSLTESALDGSNLSFTLRHLPAYAYGPPDNVPFDGGLDVGPCIGQIRLYKKSPITWPPFWNIGKGWDLPDGNESTVTRQFIDFLGSKPVQMMIALQQEPTKEWDFLPPQHQKDSPFRSVVLSLETFIQFDDYLANAWMQFCNLADINAPQAPWFDTLRIIYAMGRNGHKFADMLALTEFEAGSLAVIDISDLSSRYMLTLYDRNYSADHFLDFLLQCVAESQHQFRKLPNDAARARFSELTEASALRRFGDSLELFMKTEPTDAYGKELYVYAHAWRYRTRPEMWTPQTRATLSTMDDASRLMADLKSMAVRHGRSGISPPAKYQLRRAVIAPQAARSSGDAARLAGTMVPYDAGFVQHDDYTYEPSFDMYQYEPSFDMDPAAFFMHQNRPPQHGPPPPRGPGFDRGRGPGFRGRGADRGRGRGRGRGRFVMPSGSDPGYYGIRPTPHTTFQSGRVSLPAAPPFAPAPRHAAPGGFRGRGGGVRGRGQGGRSPHPHPPRHPLPPRPPMHTPAPASSASPGHSANVALSALASLSPSLPPEAQMHLASLQQSVAHLAVGAGENSHDPSAAPAAAAPTEGAHAASTTPMASGVDISGESEFDTFEVPDPSSQDPYQAGAEEQQQFNLAQMSQHQWQPHQLNYVADGAWYSTEGYGYYGSPGDYNDQHDGEHDYLITEAEATLSIVDQPKYFTGDHQQALLSALKNDRSHDTKIVGDSGASRFFFQLSNRSKCLAVIKLPTPIPICTGNGVIHSCHACLRILHFSRSSDDDDSAWALVVPGLLVPFDTKTTPLELGSIPTLNTLGFDVVFKNTLFDEEPHRIQSAHNSSCSSATTNGVGKLPLLDVLNNDAVIGRKLYSFYDNTPFNVCRDVQIVLQCAELASDRLTPFIKVLHDSVITKFSFAPHDFSLSHPAVIEAKQVYETADETSFARFGGHLESKHGDDSEGESHDAEEAHSASESNAQPRASHSVNHSRGLGSVAKMLRVFLLCFGLATTACLVAFGMPIKFVGGCESHPDLHAQASKRFPDAQCAKDMRKLDKDIRRGKIPPPQCDLIEGTVTCQSRCTLRWVQRPSRRYIDSHDLFYVQLRIIGYSMPRYVVLELTPPDNENHLDYAHCENCLTKMGYNCNVTRRTPSALCGDGTCRFRYILIGVRTDVSPGRVDIRKYFADTPSPMIDRLEPARHVPDELWLPAQGFVPRLVDAGEKRSLPGLNTIIDKSTWGASTFARLIGWHTSIGKGFRVYDIHQIAPTITSFGNILIYDDRDPECSGVRLLTINEMARLSSFDNETITFLQTLPEPLALQCIANAVPMGLLSTVYRAVLDHAQIAEHALVALRSGHGYTFQPPAPRPPLASVLIPTPAPRPLPHTPMRPAAARTSAPSTPAPTTPTSTSAASTSTATTNTATSPPPRPAVPPVAPAKPPRDRSQRVTFADAPRDTAPAARPAADPTPHLSPTPITHGDAPTVNMSFPSIPVNPVTAVNDSPDVTGAANIQHRLDEILPSDAAVDSVSPNNAAHNELDSNATVTSPPTSTYDGDPSTESPSAAVDDPSLTDNVNPLFARNGRMSGTKLDINPKFGRIISEPSADWPTMLSPGTPAYQKAVDRILKLHQKCGHAPAEMLEHIIANATHTGCLPGDSRYMPVCNECLIGGNDHSRSHQSSPSTTMTELIREWLPGQYWMFDVNELPVYSAFGHFRYMFVCVCPVSQYRFAYYTSTVNASDYLGFCDALVKEVSMRLGRKPLVLYCDDFSTFHQQFEVATAYSEYGIQCLSTPRDMHWLNGVAENSIRVLTRMCRINLCQLVGIVVCGVTIKDPQPFWPMAMENARQIYNSRPNPVLFRLYGVPLAPIQVYTNNRSHKLDLGVFHRFGDLCYLVDYVKDRAGKLAPVSYRGYYMFNPSWSTITKKNCDMSKADVILSARDNKLLVSGMVRYPNELVMHPRAFQDPGVALASPMTSVRHHDSQAQNQIDRGGAIPQTHDAPTGNTTQVDVIGRDGSRRTQTESSPSAALGAPLVNAFAPALAAPAPAAARTDPAATPDAQADNRTAPDVGHNPVADPNTGLRRPVAEQPQVTVPGPAAQHIPTGTVTVPDRLPPPALLRHQDLGITFRAGHTKRGTAGHRFQLYSTATTTREYFAKGGRNADWNWDIAKGIVTFVDPAWQRLAQQSIPVGSRGRFSRFAAFIANMAFAVTSKATSPFIQTLSNASSAHALRAISYNQDYSLNVNDMAAAYRTMINHSPEEYKLSAEDVTEDLLDHMMLFGDDSGVESIYLSVLNNMDVVLDEQHIVSLKGMDTDMRKRMLRAIRKEIVDLLKIGTFELCSLPDGRQPIGSKLVLKVKYKADGSPDKDKARLVALGFLERVGVDFYSTFAPMASLTSVRTVMSIAVHHGLPIYHADVPQAFLRSLIDTEMFLKLPKGVNIVDVNDPSKSTLNGYVLRLLRSLYGLKQSPQLWNQELDRFFNRSGFTRADAETCLYHRYDKSTGKFVVVLSEVDDLVVTGNDTKMIEHFRACLINSFASTTDDGSKDENSIAWEPISSFLGIDIKYDLKEGKLRMNVAQKIKNIFDDDVHKMALHKIGHASLPQPPTLNDSDYSEDGNWSHLEMHLKKHYASLVGSLIYLHVTCRPDITYAVGTLARGMHNPTRVHVHKLKCLLKYLNGRRDTPLVYRRSKPKSHEHFARMADEDPTFFACVGSWEESDCGFDILTGFSDADFAKSHAEKRRSTSGYCFFVYGNCVNWKSKLQPLTAGSTHEAELIALSFAADEGVWLRRLLKELRFTLPSSKPTYYNSIHKGDAHNAPRDLDAFLKKMPPTPVFVDNKGTTQTVNNPMSTAQASKHLDTRYFKVRDHIREHKLRVQFIRTHLNVADFFTKALPMPAFGDYRASLMGYESDNY